MNRLHELFSIALDVFNLATSRGFYFLPFLFAIAYLILSDDEKHKRAITFLLAPTALGMLILLSISQNTVSFCHISSRFFLLPQL